MTATYCRICEAACGLTFEPSSAALPRLRPDRAHPVSAGFVCAKGTRFAEVAHHPSRITRPVLRRDRLGSGGGALEPTTWTRALHESAARLRHVVENHGPHAVALYIGNPLAFHAVGQLAAIFFGRALGTRNVFTAGSQDCNNKFAAGALLHGSPVLHPIPDLEHAELAVLFGTNPAVSQSSFVHLEGGSTIFDRMQARGARIVWVDVRETESAKRWGELVPVRAGTDVWLILSLLGLTEAPPEDARVEGFEVLHALAREVSPERAEAITGAPAARIRELARAIASRPTALHMSVGVNQGPFGTLSYVALQGLAYATGNLDRRGGSLFSPLAVGAARAARAMGLFTSTARSRIGDFPTVFDSLPAGVLADEILTEGPDRVRALVVIAGDPVRSVPGAARLERAIAGLESVICLDLFESRTGRHADVILPATSWLERADLALPGLPLQTVDLLQTTPAMMPRVGDARPEHEVLAELSLRMRRPLFGSRALARLIASPGLADRALPAVTDLAWRLFDRDPGRRGYGIPVPRPRPERYLGRGPMTAGRRVRFWHPDLEPERERLRAKECEALEARASGGYVLLGRRRRIGHNSWLHGGTRAGTPEGVAWIAREDQARLGLADGDAIVLSTATGRLRLPAVAKDGVRPGTVVVPHGELEINVNELLPAGAAHIEPISGQLCMTGVPVALTPAAGERA